MCVRGFRGTPITTVAGEQGATGLALSPDGGTLYAALADGGATLTETARWSAGAGGLGGRALGWLSYRPAPPARLEPGDGNELSDGFGRGADSG
ncbi:hypothetical protein P1P75_00465 [Streptomyces sp. ID05-39B]|uniref:hypothetical protein n=1 Tax=Streptomyces sp. ID05-39B TaxID=3028664 RepID=UPI0029B6E639|nr:hypothetical protein [Streptomyces sp. ID05-39B]MDX3524968.1 hypothetical protein [Streptomyces sp. ID05-39B]